LRGKIKQTPNLQIIKYYIAFAKAENILMGILIKNSRMQIDASKRYEIERV